PCRICLLPSPHHPTDLHSFPTRRSSDLRLGLTKGSLPNTLDEVHGFITQDEIVKLSDLLGNDIASEVESRKRTLARDERAKRLSAREQRSAPRSSLRYSNRRGSEYDR